MTQIAGSLWSVPEDDQLPMAHALVRRGLRRFHWDSTDGRFAASGGFTPELAARIARDTGTTAEAHIMARRSASEVDAWTEFCDLVIVHAESEDWSAAIDRVVRRGGRPGLAISPQTPARAVPDDLDVLCMSITPGQAGSLFDETVLAKVSALRARSGTRRIGIDGGVTRAHLERAAAAGADWLVVGTDLVFDDEGRWEGLLTPAR